MRSLLDAKAAVDATDERGRSALSVGAVTGNAVVVELLLEHGAPLDAIGVTARLY